MRSKSRRRSKTALHNADFVLISILPGTFDDMDTYVHGTEPWGIYQTVGDMTGPAGIFRALIMMPMCEVIAKAIERVCPNAWVLNFTNPMTMCVQTLYHVFPKIKAFGNCHEVFFVQRILARALKEETGIEVDFKDIQINVQGINHFTWINRAGYQNIDILPLYETFAKRYQLVGLQKGDDWNNVGPFGSAERVKLDLFLRTGIVAAAGDRHLVEFLPHRRYLKDKATIASWRFFLTPVALRKQIMANGDASAKRILAGEETLRITPSGEDGIAQIRALLGLENLVTNVNLPNVGQIANLAKGHVVETNALFRPRFRRTRIHRKHARPTARLDLATSQSASLFARSLRSKITRTGAPRASKRPERQASRNPGNRPHVRCHRKQNSTGACLLQTLNQSERGRKATLALLITTVLPMWRFQCRRMILCLQIPQPDHSESI
ncbi:MAG: hypothetical protein MZU97_20430 [Bacillus subtilis]|nr:hypothetical protein [Bacillus subtilis]